MWRTVKLGDIATVIAGQSPKGEHYNKEGNGTPFYQGKKDYGERYLNPPTVWTDVVTKLAEKDDILMSVRAPVGALNIATQQLCIGRGLAAIRPADEVIHDYLFYSLLLISHQLEGSAGAIFNSINKKQIEEIAVPLPPLAEQQRIVAKLDAAFAEIDRTIEATKSGAESLEKTLVQHLHHCFSFIEEKSYKYVGDVAEHCLGKMLDKKKNKGEMKPYLRNLNVRWFNVTTDDLLEMKFESHEHERYSVRKGDLLICEGGYPGRAAIWNSDDEIYIQKAIHRVRFPNQIQNFWLMYYLYYLDVSNKLKQYFTGSGIQHFTGKALAKLPFPFLADDLVEGKLQTISAMQRHIEEAAKIYEQKGAALESLKSAILAQELQPPRSEAA